MELYSPLLGRIIVLLSSHPDVFTTAWRVYDILIFNKEYFLIANEISFGRDVYKIWCLWAINKLHELVLLRVCTSPPTSTFIFVMLYCRRSDCSIIGVFLQILLIDGFIRTSSLPLSIAWYKLIISTALPKWKTLKTYELSQLIPKPQRLHPCR